MDMNKINELLDEINADRSVPRNIRTLIEDAKRNLNSNLDFAVKINSAISTLEEVSKDPNIPIYTRTQIWNILYLLEVLNETEKTKVS